MDKITIMKNWLLSRIGNPYLMGGTGQFCTPSYRKARMAQYPSSAEKIRKNCPRTNDERANSCVGCQYYDEVAKTGKRAYDCAQLTRWAMDSIGISLVSGATSQWKKTAWFQTGEMDCLPKDKLCLVFRQDKPGTMGHTGVYMGDGTVVHARGHDDGVVRQTLKEYDRWTHWGIPEGLYSDNEQEQAESISAAMLQLEQAVETLKRCLKEEMHGAG